MTTATSTEQSSMTATITRTIRYHGWSLPKGSVVEVIHKPHGTCAPHPRVEGAWIDLPDGYWKPTSTEQAVDSDGYPLDPESLYFLRLTGPHGGTYGVLSGSSAQHCYDNSTTPNLLRFDRVSN